MPKKGKKVTWTYCLIWGTVITVFLIVLLNIMSAWLVSSEKIVQEKMMSLASTVCLISGMVGGMYAAKKRGAKYLITGICTGAIPALLVVALTLAMTGKLTEASAYNCGSLVIGSLSGGVLAATMKSKRKK